MAFVQNQDSLKTLKLIIFLIVIEALFIMASAIITYAETQRDTYSLGENPNLTVGDFVWNSHVDVGGSFENPGRYEARIDGKLYVVYCNEGDIARLSKIIDNLNIDFAGKSKNSFGFLEFLFTTITFSIVPYPFNIVPLMVTTIIGFILIYLGYSEVRAWIDTLVPF
jgi:hypothetical protein